MQLEASRPAMPAAPTLVLVPAVASVDASEVKMRDGEPSVLGLGLTHRTVLAARRAGYGRIFFLARDRAVPQGATSIADWGALADALRSQGTPLVIAPATILSETDWLKRLAATPIEPAAWGAIPDTIPVL